MGAFNFARARAVSEEVCTGTGLVYRAMFYIAADAR